MCCPAKPDEVRAALSAGRERELGLRELVGRLVAARRTSERAASAPADELPTPRAPERG